MEKITVENMNERREKPPVLYIGTQNAGIKEFTPRRGNYRDKDEGPVIFSTPDKAMALVFALEGHNDSWTETGYFSGVPYIVICMDRERFMKNDKGGVIYEVPSDSFDYNPNLGMREKEWTSREPVKPISEIAHQSSLDAMVDNGVQVYFVDRKTFAEISKTGDHGLKILSGLVSENVVRGKNIQAIH